MKSPFPGMDPYLEGSMWSDVHNSLIYEIRQLLAPQISPKYIAKIEPYTVVDENPGQDIGILYPDVAVLERNKRSLIKKEKKTYGNNIVLTPPSLSIPITYAPIEIRIPVLEIRDQANNQLITAIEIISPVNKRGKGLEKYRAKQKVLIEQQIHLVEIDLLRRGKRTVSYPLLPPSHYLISLIRATPHTRQEMELWTFNIQDKLPVIPIPLKTSDEAIPLDLNKALQAAYQSGYYHLAVNYKDTPPLPTFTDKEQVWIQQQVQ